MNDLKKPYEIYLWGEEFVYIIKTASQLKFYFLVLVSQDHMGTPLYPVGT